MSEPAPVPQQGDTEFVKKRAPTLYAIIVVKLFKGLLFVSLAAVVYSLADNNLPEEFRRLLQFLRINPERQFWARLAAKIGTITEANVVWTALGTLVYSLFSWVEGIGLVFRISWAGYLAIGESVFFIPIEIFELVVHGFSVSVFVILVLNVVIAWYLFQNRNRLFRHHHHHHH